MSLRSASCTMWVIVMWAIFIALFGGLYLAYKLGSDRAASKRADLELDIKKSYWENWEQTVVDNELERRIDVELTVPESAAKLKNDALNLVRSFYGLQYADFNTYYDAKYKDYYVRKLVAYIYSYGKSRYMCRKIFNIYSESRCFTAKSLRTDSRLVQCG